MLDKNDFDQWAKTYDKTVEASENDDAYPFAGYSTVLYHMYRAVHAIAACDVLDVGFGTGTLLRRFDEEGMNVFGVDFSETMHDLAQEAMPEAHLFVHDLNVGLPEALEARTYDAIVSSYVLHHFEDDKKVELIQKLYERLNPGGVLLIGDVMFASDEGLEKTRRHYASIWDDTEHYLSYITIRDIIPPSLFMPVSHCAGIITIRK